MVGRVMEVKVKVKWRDDHGREMGDWEWYLN